MKTTLTIEQSDRLIELGVDPKLASEVMINYIDPYDIDDAIERKNPIYSLTDILSILPKEIEDDELSMEWNKGHQKWEVGYGTAVWSYCSSSELILALGTLLGRAFQRGYVKSNTDEK